jgi:hypothetical protein
VKQVLPARLAGLQYLLHYGDVKQSSSSTAEVSDSRRSGRSSGSDSNSTHRDRCTLPLYKINKGRLRSRNRPVNWVGVAGFEPAASSSGAKFTGSR